MLSYDFRCNECGRDFSIKKSAEETVVPCCPVCESPNLERVGEPAQQKGCGGGCGGCGGGCNCSH